MTVNKIFEFLNSKFPISDALDFDNVGLLIGEPNQEITNILIALDCSLDTVFLACEKDCNLIITHHPVIFEPLKNVINGSVQYELIKNGISVISMHTNLDVGVGGVNETLCRVIGLQNIASVTTLDGFSLLGGIIPDMDAKSLALAIKTMLGGVVKFVDGQKTINRVLVCSGSGGNYVNDAFLNNFDALITSDVKHHQFIEAKNLGISLFDAGHFETEDIIIEPLCDLLKKEFANTVIFTHHSNVIDFA